MASNRFLPCAFALVAVVGWGCWAVPGAQKDYCSSDAECDPGKVCREARCRLACDDKHWVGERVEVSGATEARIARISACVPAYWVRYETGIEEQVSPPRVARGSERQAQ